MSQWSHYQHWRLHQDDDHILWLTCDQQQSAVNTLSQSVVAELTEIVSGCESATDLRGIILGSAKPHVFMVGADIRELNAAIHDDTEVDAVRSFIENTQVLFNRWQQLKVPTVAVINGMCLGGGLELALACRYRLAHSADDSKIGLPEIKLGIYPGWGGVRRLAHLIGPLQSMPAILKGKLFTMDEAHGLGMVDHRVPERQLSAAAKMLIDGELRVRRGYGLRRLWCMYPLRCLLVWGLQRRLKHKMSMAHYPAVMALLQSWRQHGAHPSSDSQAVTDLMDLFQRPTTRQLMRLFFLQERLKAYARPTDTTDVKLPHVHVIGAGTMGASIAIWCAFHGCKVTVYDESCDQLAAMLQRARVWAKQHFKQRCEREKALDRLIPDPTDQALPGADWVIEAVFEDLSLKQKVLANVEPRLKDSAILATNTSSIPLEELTTSLKRAERLVGIHFFNPVDKMRLVEVIRSKQTSADVYHQAMQWVGQLNKLPLPVNSAPGFCINRILMPYLMAAIQCVEDGVSVDSVDAAARAFGMPMGPLELADTVGLDVCCMVGQALAPHFGLTIPKLLQKKVDAKQWGVKTGQGFYRYQQGRCVRQSAVSANQQAIIDRILFPLWQAALQCVHSGVVADGDLVDAGMVFATGYAPFLGGPIATIQHMPAADRQARLQALAMHGWLVVDEKVWDHLEEIKS